jgi:hypothetical protein
MLELRDSAGAQQVQDVLQFVGQLSELGKAHGAAAALQGVRRAENHLKPLLAGISLQLQVLGLQNFELLLGLLHKEAKVLAHIEFGAH